VGGTWPGDKGKKDGKEREAADLGPRISQNTESVPLIAPVTVGLTRGK